MSEKEKLMYSILGKISDMDIPIVFKGALITKLVLAEKEFTDVVRETKDIDMNWVGKKQPTMEELKKVVDDAVTYSRRLRGGGASRSRQPMLPVSTS